MKIAVIRSHVASIGYEASNPFELCEWIVGIAKEDYTEICEDEFTRWFLTPNNRELVCQYTSVQFVDEYQDVYTREWLEERYCIEDGIEELLVVAPISELCNVYSANIRITSI